MYGPCCWLKKSAEIDPFFFFFLNNSEFSGLGLLLGSSGACLFSTHTCLCVCVCFDIKQLMQGTEQGTEQCSARKMLVSRGNLLQLPTGLNASEVNERKCNPDFLAVTCKAGCVGSSYRLRSQEFLWW